MKEQTLNINYQIAQLSELNETEQTLIRKAMEATHNSYANYSHFYVGAACLLADGRIVIGANQENAAFPSGLCAERSAIFGAQSNYPEQAITPGHSSQKCERLPQVAHIAMWCLPPGDS